jgi:hypothetical protein
MPSRYIEETNEDPLRLFSPKIRRYRIFAHVSRAVDRYDAENGQRQHDNQKQPVEPKQLSKKWRHVELIQRKSRPI